MDCPLTTLAFIISTPVKCIELSDGKYWLNSNQVFLFSDLSKEDYSKRISLVAWDWDRTSRNDFMGSLSFGISEVLKEPQEGWYKLLNQEEGDFYGIPASDDIAADIQEIRNKFEVYGLSEANYLFLCFYISLSMNLHVLCNWISVHKWVCSGIS